MMMSLFSVFDPSSYCGLSLNWIIVFMMGIYIPLKYYLVYGNYGGVIKFIMIMVYKLFKEVGGSNYLALGYVFVMVFMYLMLSNLMGLFPFIFTSTAHPCLTMSLGIVMWVAFFLMGWLTSFKYSAAHLVPEGSPLFLSPLMVIIESISHLIRPFTLSIRLAANMMAGHLIVGLLSSISMIHVYSFYVSLLLQSLMMILEFGVAIIQGFVFSILLLLYVLEYY